MRIRNLKTELQSLERHQHDESHRRKAFDASKRIESSNLLREIKTYEALDEFHNYTVARDTFLSHLGSTLWGSMRHIIAPSMADGAFRYYDQISYQLYFITRNTYESFQLLPVDLQAIKDGLSSLVLSSQKVTFSRHMLALSNDPALAMAFSVARRAAAVPILFVNGTYIKTVSNYLDSSIIQHQLRRLDDQNTLKGNHADRRLTLEVPIFWFIHSDQLLVDKHYQAKALSDIIVVVQSGFSSWESHLQCNGQPLVWDLRNPIKAAIAAAAEHLAGLLPHHLIYSHAHETAIEDWIWSVGCSPFSITSQGWRLSQFHLDAIARSYIITALEESIQTVNSAIQRLSLEKPTQKSYKHFQPMEHKLVNHYDLVVTPWRQVAHFTGDLHFVEALKLLNNVEDASNSFAEQVNKTIALLHPIHCTRERNVEVVFDMSTIPAFMAVLFIIWIVLKPKQIKPKIN